MTAQTGSWEWLRGTKARHLGIDTRALAVFRVSLGTLLLADLVLRAREVRVFYTDAGVLPTSALADLFPTLASVSLHAVSGALWYQALLFVVAAVFAVAVAVGYRTRLALLVSFVLLASLQARNPYVLTGGDTMLLVLVFLGVFLPLGARWSIDSVRYGGHDETRAVERVFSVASVTALTFLVVVYTTNAVLRYRSDVWMSGDAVEQVFGIESLVVYLGPYLAEIPVALTAINWLWTAMLTASVGLVVLVGWWRVFFVAGYVAAHVGMALTLRLGLFPFVVIAALVLFVPPIFWDRVEPLTGAVERRLPEVRRYVSTDTEAVMPASVRRGASRVAPVVVGTVLVAYLVWQAAALGYVGVPGDGAVHPEEHSWKMFAPNPPTTDGWYVTRAETEGGDEFDALNGGEVGYDRPPDLTDAYPTLLWDRYLSEMRYGTDAELGVFADYLCRTAGDAERVTVYYFEESVVEDTDAERIQLVEEAC